MNKNQMKYALLCFGCVFLIVGAGIYFGYISLTVTGPTGPTTTGPTHTPTTGDFLIDKAIGGNTENGMPDGIPMDSANTEFPYKVTTKLKFTEKDFLSRAAVSGSGTIILYDYTSEEQLESNTFSSGVITTGNNYVSGQHLKFKITETGYVTYYGEFTVPYWNDWDPATIDLTAYLMDLPAAYEQTCEFINGTAVADAANIDVSASATGGLLELVFENQMTVDDDGYWSSYNFLADVAQNAYFVLHFVGTGTDSVIVQSTDDPFERVVIAADNDVWVFWKLTDNDISRDLLPDGVTRSPNGIYNQHVTLEVSGITSGDSVTVTYGVYWYADGNYLRSMSMWAPQNGQGSAVDTCVIVP